MKVVILAGGFGTRLSEETQIIPKPMVPIGGKPILIHIMEAYSRQGFDEFVVALGYKGDVIKRHFLEYFDLACDLHFDMGSGTKTYLKQPVLPWKVSLIDTGESTLTGTRLRKLSSYIGDERFMLTYGDGLCDVSLKRVIETHEQKNALITLTAVRPRARFGELAISDNSVIDFQEKQQMHEGWINGGFFVVEPAFLDLIPHTDVMLEREPMAKAVSIRKLAAHKHDGFWMCMDTKRDQMLLNDMMAEGKVPWLDQVD